MATCSRQGTPGQPPPTHYDFFGWVWEPRWLCVRGYAGAKMRTWGMCLAPYASTALHGGEMMQREALHVRRRPTPPSLRGTEFPRTFL